MNGSGAESSRRDSRHNDEDHDRQHNKQDRHRRRHDRRPTESDDAAHESQEVTDFEEQTESRRPSVSLRQHDFLAERRVSHAELERRHTWLEKTRMSIASVRNRCRVTHEVSFPDSFNGLYSARFSENGEIIAVGFGAGGVQIRNGETGELRATLRSGMETSFPILCCRFNPSKKYIFYASSACGNIFMCNTHTNEFTRFINEPKNEVNAVDLSVTGDHLVSGGKDAALRVYDTETAKLISTYQKSGVDLIDEKVTKFHRMRIFATRFHHSYPDMIISGGWDDTVKIWDIRIGTGSIRSINGPHICGDAIDMRENNVLTGSWVVRDSLQIWDVLSAKLIDTISPENRPSTLEGEFIYTTQYFDGDPYGELILAGGSGTGVVEVISSKEKKATCTTGGTRCANYSKQDNDLWIDDVMKYCMIIYQSLVEISNGLNDKSGKNGLARNVLISKVMGTFNVSKPIVTIDSCRTTITFGGMESLIRLADYS